jgi:hypothetical protein
MITDLKGKLKLGPALEGKRTPEGGKKDGGKGSGVKTKNKKNTGLKTHQKKGEAWKKQPPKDGEPTTKEVAGKKFQWCIHHWNFLPAFTPPQNATLAPLARTLKLKVRGRRTTSPSRTSLLLMPPRLPPSLAVPALPPSSPSSPKMKNDGARWHVHGVKLC